MKFPSNPSVFVVAMTALLLAMAGLARGAARTLSLPSYLANPGSTLEVPLMLDNAAGLAALRVQINFNPAVLELQAVTAGPLGEAFELSQGNGEGFVQLVFARAASLANGSGRLATLRFHVNAGAVQDLYSELAIADLNLSDSTGVVDLRQQDTLTTTGGMVAVSLSTGIDNARNGLPDWWEALHGLNLLDANANLDPEHDGLPNLLEYAFGGNPNLADAQQRGTQSTAIEVNGQTFLCLGFYRRTDDVALIVRVQESQNLGLWNDLNLPQQIVGTPQNMGDGTEFICVRGLIPAAGINAQPRGFLRVAVERP